MKTTHILFIFLLIPFLSFSQSTEDVIYLKNGNIIKGNIIQQTADKFRIESRCGNIFNYALHDIDSIKQEKYLPENTLKTKGYIGTISIGSLIGASVNDKPYPFSVLVEQQYRFFNYSSIGVFSGMEAIYEPTVPLGICVKGLLPVSGSTIYIDGKVGFGFSVAEPDAIDFYYEIKEHNGGWLFNAEIGYIFTGTKHNSYFIALGYRHQALHYVRNDWYYNDVDRDYYFNRISLRMGIMIH